MRLERVASWASDNGFEMLEVACWPATGGERRRYAGVSHIDVVRLDLGKVRDVLDRNGLEISSLAYYPNNLHPDPGERRDANTHLRKVVDAAARLGVPTVATPSACAASTTLQRCALTASRSPSSGWRLLG